MNLKEEFIEWIYKNSKPNLSAVGRNTISKNIDESNDFFVRDIMDVDQTNYEEMVEFLKDELYKTNTAFQEYNASVASGRPRAILGKENYLRFLEEKFGSKNIKDVNYWIFQCNPKIYDLKNALRNDAVKMWTVAAHKEKIKPGDKVIIWQTGNEAGCLALGEVLTEPAYIEEMEEEKEFYYGKDQSSGGMRVKMDILHDFTEEPVFWQEIKDLPEFKDFKAGNQGTNFSATKHQYDILKNMNGKENNEEIEFNRIISRLDNNESLNYFSLLDEIKEKLNLESGDERVDFSTASNKLGLVVGNRYCWNIKPVKNSHLYFAISPQKINESSSPFGKSGPMAFATESEDFEIFEKNSGQIVGGVKNELTRTNVTRHKRNNKIFEKAVFDLDFRRKILELQIPSNVMNESLNTILYGPPGTGKTYYSKELAVRIANPDIYLEDLPIEEKRDKINDEYKRMYDQGQIVFTTFHQSFSYEDFVEGIKPETVEKEVTYDTIPGLLKELCEKADTKVNSNFEEVISQFKKDLIEKEKITINTGSIEFDVFYKGGKTFKINPKESKATNPQYPASIENVLKMYKNTNEEGMYNPSYVRGILNYLYKEYDLKRYESISSEHKNYVLIIDEINRGNVSAIFGELITLLEADKRIGAKEEIKVKLPYSKMTFGVPSNLFIIGTMNTADRSVEALDTALRRRFAFKEIMPQPQLLTNISFSGFNLQEVLETINKRIEALLDRDHTIGHSYFIKIVSGETAALKEAFQNKIIPLLQEYFYHDYEKIALILGEGFIERKEEKVHFASFNQIDDPEILPSFELKKDIEDIEAAVRKLLNRKDEEAA